MDKKDITKLKDGGTVIATNTGSAVYVMSFDKKGDMLFAVEVVK